MALSMCRQFTRRSKAITFTVALVTAVAITMSSCDRSMERYNIDLCRERITRISEAIALYEGDHDHLPATLGELVTLGYLDVVDIMCPSVGVPEEGLLIRASREDRASMLAQGVGVCYELKLDDDQNWYLIDKLGNHTSGQWKKRSKAEAEWISGAGEETGTAPD